MNSALEIIYNRALRLDSNGNTVTDETLIRVGGRHCRADRGG